MTDPWNGGRNSMMAKRLRWVRAAEGVKTSTEWAKRIGWSPSQLSNYENGVRLSFDAAITLVSKVPGLSIDWLVFGNEMGMSLDLRARVLAEAEKERKPAAVKQQAKPRKKAA
jgi:transcriptional regulator with XRE-family HTH domain